MILKISRLDLEGSRANCLPGITSVSKISPSVCPDVISNVIILEQRASFPAALLAL